MINNLFWPLFGRTWTNHSGLIEFKLCLNIKIIIIIVLSLTSSSKWNVYANDDGEIVVGEDGAVTNAMGNDGGLGVGVIVNKNDDNYILTKVNNIIHKYYMLFFLQDFFF